MIRVESILAEQRHRLAESRENSLATLCARLTRETFAPVTVLIDRNLECLYCSGPTERYLHVPEGAPSHNFLAMVREDLRAALLPALRHAWHHNRRLTIDGGPSMRETGAVALRVHLLPVPHESEELMMVCFIEEPQSERDGEISAPVIEIGAENVRALPVKLFPVKAVLLRPVTALALSRPAVFIIDKDGPARAALRMMLEQEGHLVEDFASCEAFLAVRRSGQRGCLLIDPDLSGMTALDLLDHLDETGQSMPAIIIATQSSVKMAVQAMKAGACDFLDKPLNRSELLDSLRRALEKSSDEGKISAGRTEAVNRIAGLTPRQHQIMAMLLAGHPNKNIAADLDISQRTVEHHRATIMEKTGSRSLPALARLALAAVQ